MNFLVYESSIEEISVYDFLLEIRTSGFIIIFDIKKFIILYV